MSKLLDFGRNLTAPEGGEEYRKRSRTYAGMAHFSGTGPSNKTCRECSYWMHTDWYANSKKHGGAPKDSRCGKFQIMTGRCGAAVPHSAEACKYFDQREAVVPLRRPDIQKVS